MMDSILVILHSIIKHSRLKFIQTPFHSLLNAFSEFVFFSVSILAQFPWHRIPGAASLYFLHPPTQCALSVKSPLDQLRPPQPQDWQDLENQEQPPGNLLAHSVGESPTNHASRKPSFDLRHKTHLEIDINSGYLQSKICCRKHIPVTLVCFPMIKTVPRSM